MDERSRSRGPPTGRPADPKAPSPRQAGQPSDPKAGGTSSHAPDPVAAKPPAVIGAPAAKEQQEAQKGKKGQHKGHKGSGSKGRGKGGKKGQKK